MSGMADVSRHGLPQSRVLTIKLVRNDDAFGGISCHRCLRDHPEWMFMYRLHGERRWAGMCEPCAKQADEAAPFPTNGLLETWWTREAAANKAEQARKDRAKEWTPKPGDFAFIRMRVWAVRENRVEICGDNVFSVDLEDVFPCVGPTKDR